MTGAFQSTFTRLFDVIVVGSGHAGFAAAMRLRASGRSVLLIGPRGDLLWESGRCFCPDAGRCDDDTWHDLTQAVAARGGYANGQLDGAIAEVVATDQLMTAGVAVLYYAQPVAVERAATSGGAIEALLVATRSGLRRVAGRQWIDATETGELLRLCGGSSPRRPAGARAWLALQHADWSALDGATLPAGLWPTQRLLPIEVRPGDVRWRSAIPAALDQLAATLGDAVADVSVSHLSIEPLPTHDRAAAGVASPAPNLALASPACAATSIQTLADRFALGLSAAAALAERPVHEVAPQVIKRPLPDPFTLPWTDQERRQVAVAGLGTGGALAALAAARAGASVVAIDPLAFAGGIGSGGGIHAYYWGVAGGLQQQVDERVRDLMKLWRGGPLGDGPFNPWAKMMVLDAMLEEAGVSVRQDAWLFALQRKGDRVTAALAATPGGIIRLDADQWVDATGDGDLAAFAGAAFTMGRSGDGLPHAYSQSSGRLREHLGRPRMAMVNFDAGWCDPTDPEDLTRARLVGIRQYLLPRYDNLSRPTYIAPAIGLRQGRQVVTEHVLSLDDQIMHRRFDDAIGYTGCHYDNHAVDYEFESDEALFWVWANRRWRLPYACEMPLRMLIPRGLANVWIGSRCLGVSQDAHHSCRMQRDVQRAGEAAGVAAALAAKLGVGAMQLPYEQVRAWLDQTGAMSRRAPGVEPLFSPDKQDELDASPPDERQAALDALDRGEPGPLIWWLYRHRSISEDAVKQRLVSDRPMTSWLAASIVALWADADAQPRLLEAIAAREYGFGEGFNTYALIGHSKWDGSQPTDWNRVVPNWLVAAALLRCCGTMACLPALADLARRPVHALTTVTTLALTLERLARRGAIERGHDAALAMLDDLHKARLVGVFDQPQRCAGAIAHRAMAGQFDADTPAVSPAFGQDHCGNTAEDFTWQAHLAIARARVALGQPPEDEVHRYRHDPRALVRRAFAPLLEPDAAAPRGRQRVG